jgi:hypothetical protein
METKLSAKVIEYSYIVEKKDTHEDSSKYKSHTPIISRDHSFSNHSHGRVNRYPIGSNHEPGTF